ncbi:type II toxin-antitoxin system RelE/ParE family toxin [Thalassospira permensis]|uniref:Toxin Y4kP n=1 Tax=Thalassospira permensis NBRC 106175 TaxID=1353532 RepID=A0ABR4TRD7_9PROT|nr:type II toxin-antitoxin system RelE/ParE family toxin [Thalassospira permensis]KEO58289.1 toxin Y4kP [Thalassospira permensis NBRC 106175]
MKIEWDSRAVEDLRDIVDYIDERNPVAALKTYQLIAGSVSQLATHPFIGRVGRVARTREMIVNGTPYLVAYCLGDDTVTVIAVLHAARRWPDEF